MPLDRGPESEWKDWICPLCEAVYFEIEQTRAQAMHNRAEVCGGTLRELGEID